MNNLRTSHYNAMRKIGYTDDEIERDWKQFSAEYEEYLEKDMALKGAEDEDHS